jgi:predicted SAM-dependent methyltransferase
MLADVAEAAPTRPQWSSGRLPPRVERAARLAVSQVLRNRKVQTRFRSLEGREYLDIGCGPNRREGVIGLDFQWRPGVDLCWDVTHGIPLPDASLRGVFSEHCIEHLSLADGVAMLEECHRVLRPGGALRVVTPDGELYLSEYVRIRGGGDGPMPRDAREGHGGVKTPIMSVNRVFNNFGHRFIWDFDTFRDYLQRIGFVDVRRAEFGEGRDARVIGDTEWRRVGSLYVEATKPG